MVQLMFLFASDKLYRFKVEKYIVFVLSRAHSFTSHSGCLDGLQR